MSRRTLLSLAIGLAIVGFLGAYLWQPISRSIAQGDFSFLESEPDIPAMLNQVKGQVSKEEFLINRAEHFARLRGLDGEEVKDPTLRSKALVQLEDQLQKRSRTPEFEDNAIIGNAWAKIGPAPLIEPSGARSSGRTIAIAVHPTNPNFVFAGTAQGGLYRSTDGGTNWTPLMDNAQSLAIGAIAFAPSDPETVYIGTGEHNFSADSFFGVGIYRINNATTTSTISGPYNKNISNIDIFTGRGISEIIVHPTDPNTIFVSTTRGIGGMGATSNSFLPAQGIYRSTNANGVTPTFEKLLGLAGGADVAVRDIAIDPTNANILVAGVVAGGGVGGIYRSTDALAPAPVFSQREVFTSTSTSELTSEFASVKPAEAADATFYAAVGNLGGRVLRSTNGGLDWVQQIDNNFCTPQCFYNIAIDVDPTNPAKVFLGGAPSLVAGVSTTSGAAFTSTGSGVHVDTHAFAVAKSDPNIVYLGTDGGIYKSINGGTNFSHLNTSQYFATQFMGIAVHPTDPNYTIGGTQDNGTNAYTGASVAWNRIDGGDGGFAVIDQNATDTTTVRIYHTYFSQTNQMGYVTRNVGGTASGGWSTRGCFSSVPNNGINCNDSAVLFYAPLERGPGTPNTVYYGTDRLYRSDNLGVTHTVASQAPISSGNPISAIAIGPQSDNLRLVGLRNGILMGTATGSATLIDLDPTGTIPNGYISRIAIDPNNSNNAYVVLSIFGVNNVFKTTNLNNLSSSTAPTWTLARGTGGNVVPLVPTNSIVIDPLNGQTVYAGTDIGVYMTTDGGANWAPLGTDLPRVAVFGMAIAPGTPRKLRIATHGKGMYEITLDALRKAPFDYDGDGRSDVSVWRAATGTWYVGRSSLSDMYVQPWGLIGDTIVPADYDGDGKTDLAVRRPTDDNFYVFNSSNATVEVRNFGISGDIPIPSDYNGDGKADVAVWRPSNGTWYLSLSGSGIFYVMPWGLNSDKPAPGDFDGDGKTELAVFRPSDGKWYTFSTVTGTISVTEWGVSGDQPVQGDYNGDGRTDFAVYRPSNNTWYRQNSNDGAVATTQWGLSGDFPVPGDYDGDGKIDVAVWRPSDATWYVNRSGSGIFTQTFGLLGDTPTPSAFVF